MFIHRSLFLILLSGGIYLQAQWSTDAGTNLAITNMVGEETDPLLAVLPDGSCYVGWFHSVGAPDYYQVRLQLLSPEGLPQFGADGLLISAHPHNSFTTGWDLITDSTGNAILAFTDIRAEEPDVYAYRIDSEGTFLWGANGVTLTENTDSEYRPFITEMASGKFAFAWTRSPISGDGDIRLQLVTTEGTISLAQGGVAIVTEAGTSPTFPDLVSSGLDEVIVSWVPDFNARYIKIQKFDANGDPVWPGDPLTVFDGSMLQMGYQPILQSDGNGGGFMTWYAQDLDCYAQRVDADGNFLYAAGGAHVSTNTAQLRVSPSAALDESTGELYVFWVEKNSSQSMHGIYAQKLSPTGARLWGDSGQTLVSLDGQSKSFVQAIIQEKGAEAFWFQSPDVVNSLVKGTRVDEDGIQYWGTGSPIDISSVVSGKGRLSSGRDTGGTSYLIWNDDRSGDNVYGQSVTPDGELGGLIQPCIGDCIGDTGVVDIHDLNAAIDAWPGPSACDIDESGFINMLDLVGMFDLFGECP